MIIKIIGISGVTGTGKTTLAKALAKNLQASIVAWDDFDDISVAPDDYVTWYTRGRNFNEWDYKTLSYVLQNLKRQRTVIHPALKNTLVPTEYIVFDAPLGRLHQQTGQYIDICIHIELPLDVSLCRRIIRDFKGNNKTKEDLLEEIEFYLSSSRPLYFDDELKQNANLIINGMLSTEAQIQEIKKYL